MATTTTTTTTRMMKKKSTRSKIAIIMMMFVVVTFVVVVTTTAEGEGEEIAEISSLSSSSSSSSSFTSSTTSAPPTITTKTKTIMENYKKLPPGPILLLTRILDIITNQRWRYCTSFISSIANPESNGYLSHVVPSVTQHLNQFHLVTFNEIKLHLNNNNNNSNNNQESSSSWSGVFCYNVHQFLIKTPSSTLSCLTSQLSFFVILPILVLFFRLLKFIFLPKFRSLGLYMARRTYGRHTTTTSKTNNHHHHHHPSWEIVNYERIIKFGEYVFRLCYHVFVSVWGCVILLYYNCDWWYDRTLLFRHHPKHDLYPSMIWYYLIQSAYNVEALVSLLELSFTIERISTATTTTSSSSYREKDDDDDNNNNNNDDNDCEQEKEEEEEEGWIINIPNIFYYYQQNHHHQNNYYNKYKIKWSETCRGDFREMVVHHVVTNALIFSASAFKFARIGCMTMFVHDVSDIPVDMSKLANFLKWKKTTIICFVLMVLTWFIARLYILPFVIFRAILYDSFILVIDEDDDDGGFGGDGVNPVLYKSYHFIFVTLVTLIIILHVIWFGMFIQMGYVLIKKGEAHDLSEHKGGEAYIRHEGKNDDDDDVVMNGNGGDKNGNRTTTTTTTTTAHGGGVDNTNNYSSSNGYNNNNNNDDTYSNNKKKKNVKKSKQC